MKIVKITTWDVVEHVTIRTLLERYKASGNNIHCMHGLHYADSIYGELYEFTRNWGWIQKQPLDKKLYIIDEVTSTAHLT